MLGAKVDAEERTACVDELTAYVDRFRHIPAQLREFLCQVVERVYRMRRTSVVRKHGWSEYAILVSDLARAFRMAEWTIAQWANELAQYGVAGLTHLDTDLGDQPAVAIYELHSGWPLWSDLAEFCDKAATPLRAFAIEMDFVRLDG